VRNLTDMNHCLLLKFIHKLYDPTPLPWKRWFLSASGSVPGDDTYLHHLIKDEIPRCRKLTNVQVGDGRLTSSWHDSWIFNMPLAEAFPVLFPHCIKPNLTVQQAVTLPLDNQLRPRLTGAAATSDRSSATASLTFICWTALTDGSSTAHYCFHSALGTPTSCFKLKTGQPRAS